MTQLDFPRCWWPISEVTQVLQAIDAGKPHAADQLLPLVYDELRRLAAAQMAREKPGHTTDATALVALEQLHLALTLQEKLVAEFPGAPSYRKDLSETHINLANCLVAIQQEDDAAKHLRLAQTIREKLVADFPNVPNHRAELARIHSHLGVLLENSGKFTDAETHHRQGLALLEKLVADVPNMPEFRRQLAHGHNNFGKLLISLDQGNEAEDHYHRALTVQEQFVKENPAVGAYRVEFGVSCANFGLVLCSAGKPAQSIPWFEKAISVLQPEFDKEKRNVLIQQALRGGYGGRAMALTLLHKPDQADADWERSFALIPETELPQFRKMRAQVRLEAGIVAEAVAETEELARMSHWQAGDWYAFARIYAMGSDKVADKKQAYSDRAIELLRSAIKAGYRDVAHLKRDRDLGALRDREDFKKLILELESKSPPEP